ncbi:hypothetical protein GGX14DRAFT_348934 [Mycena pura]|uniref:Zinc finger CHCC-type domain-containing protein n=1 Tax=Mycena pura TaxID=153505 RepID=A0AAD6YPU0_9AGAR|nr:hypothetical protein GGX14DRAFT_348934 [Mycena pura]
MLRRAVRIVARRPPPRSFSATAPSVPAEVSKTPVAPPQAPNAASTWSTNQQPRSAATSGPRFEQTAMELQPAPLSAMSLISEVPATMVHGRKAVCDGGGGPLGHPKIYINLDLPGPRPCGYALLQSLSFRADILLSSPVTGMPQSYLNIHLLTCSQRSPLRASTPSPLTHCPIIFGSICRPYKYNL